MKGQLTVILCLTLAATAVAAEGKPLRITGQVVDRHARPVAGAEVVAFERANDYLRGPVYARMLGAVQRTDREGRFVLDVTTTSQYFTFVVARQAGHALGWDRMNWNHNDRADMRSFIVLEAPQTLAATLVDTAGRPVVGARVRAVPKNSYLSRLRQKPICGPEDWLAVDTDAEGHFAFRNFPADASMDFWVTVAGRDLRYEYTPHVQTGIGFEVGKEGLCLVLPPATTVEGTVIDRRRGTRIGGVRLAIRPSDPQNCECRYHAKEVISDADGKFSVTGVPPGRHLLWMIEPTAGTAPGIAKATVFEVTGHQEREEVTVRIEPGALLEIVARDQRSHRAMPDVTVSVANRSFCASKGDPGFYQTARTGADGVVQMRVPPGRCVLHAWNADYVCPGADYSRPGDGVQVTTVGSRTLRVEMALVRVPKLHGTVVADSGQPAPGAVVSIYPFGHTVFADGDGQFEARLASGRPVKVVGARDRNRNLAGMTNVKNASGSLRIELEPAVSVTGRIVDADGVGIPAARIRLDAFVSNGTSFFDEVLADAQGRYEIEAVVPQRDGLDYRLTVNAAGYAPIERQRVAVKGPAGESVEIPDVTLVPANVSTSGIVVSRRGTPAAGVPVFVSGDMTFDQPRRTVSTDAEGRFEVARICKGPLKFQANFGSSPGGSGVLWAYGGDQDVKIVLGQELTHTAGKSLVGRPLPDMSAFEVDADLEGLEGHRVLVCFAGFYQDPSKRCIQQLQRQADALWQAGVHVVCINGVWARREAVVRWKEEEQIVLPVGMVGSDAVKARQAWAVPSLPWLILTDTRHVVTAEGFALKALPDKLKE